MPVPQAIQEQTVVAGTNTAAWVPESAWQVDLMAKGTLRLQIWTFSPRSTIERYFPRWSLNSAIFADFMLI